MSRSPWHSRLVALALVSTLLVGACAAVPAAPGGSGTAGRPSGGPPTPRVVTPRPGSSTPAQVAGAPARPTGPTQAATLVRVVDGDTIRVRVGGTEEPVRYIGMNTPELFLSSAATPEPFARVATDANARLLAGGRIVLEKDVSERDQYGRLLRDVWIVRDGVWTLVDLALVAEGYAEVATYPPDVKYVDVLLAAQRAARTAGRGLWGGSAP